MALTGSQSQSCITMVVQRAGESLRVLVYKTSMTYNYKMKEIKRDAGSQTSRIVPRKPGNAGGGKRMRVVWRLIKGLPYEPRMGVKVCRVLY